MWGGGVLSNADAGKRGGSGTAYVECAGATRGLFLQGAETFDSERRLTELVDDGVSLYDFSHVGLYEGAVLGFAPANVPSEAMELTYLMGFLRRTGHASQMWLLLYFHV